MDKLIKSINKLINTINNNIKNKIIINNNLDIIFNDIIKKLVSKTINSINTNLNTNFLIKINTKNKCIKCNRPAEYMNQNKDNICWIHSLKNIET